MASKLYYSVVKDYENNWGVSSFGGKSKAEEKRFALSLNAKCILVTTDYDAALRCYYDAKRLDKVAAM